MQLIMSKFVHLIMTYINAFILERVLPTEDTHEEGAPSQKRAIVEGKHFT